MHRLISSPRRSVRMNHATDREHNDQSIDKIKDNVVGHKEQNELQLDRSMVCGSAPRDRNRYKTGDAIVQLQLHGSNTFKVHLTFGDRPPIGLRVMNLALGIFSSMCPLELRIHLFANKAYGSLFCPFSPFLLLYLGLSVNAPSELGILILISYFFVPRPWSGQRFSRVRNHISNGTIQRSTCPWKAKMLMAVAPSALPFSNPTNRTRSDFILQVVLYFCLRNEYQSNDRDMSRIV